MKRTILTLERKAVREAQESKWFDAGVQIGKMKITHVELGWKYGLENMFVDCTGPEVKA